MNCDSQEQIPRRAAGADLVPQLVDAAGADFRDIKRQGAWRHDGTVQGYIEEAGLFEENTAGSLLRSRVKPA